MADSERPSWILPTLVLSAVWFVVTVAVVVLNVAAHSALPDTVLKVGPFLIAGLLTGRLVNVSLRLPKIIAVAVLAIVSATAWTSFTFATREISVEQALLLFALALPINLFAALWAYFGMYLVSRSRESGSDPELQDIERELRDEIDRRKKTTE
jgi:hypothetical protein